jgi:hypothetical protein
MGTMLKRFSTATRLLRAITPIVANARKTAVGETFFGRGAAARARAGSSAGSQNHSTGDEKLWWEKHNIDPLEIARKLWDESRKNLWPPALVR